MLLRWNSNCNVSRQKQLQEIDYAWSEHLGHLDIVNAHNSTLKWSIDQVTAFFRTHSWMPSCRNDVRKLLRCDRFNLRPVYRLIKDLSKITAEVASKRFQDIGIEIAGAFSWKKWKYLEIHNLRILLVSPARSWIWKKFWWEYTGTQCNIDKIYQRTRLFQHYSQWQWRKFRRIWV